MNTMDHRNLNLYCILLGCTPQGRNTEQHDVMFGVAQSVEDLYDNMKTFWYEPIVKEVAAELKKKFPGLDIEGVAGDLLHTFARQNKVHIDAWMKVEYVDGYKISVQPKAESSTQAMQLYFVNLGGYKEGEFEEFHKKLFVVANNVTEVTGRLKNNEFMKQYTPQALGIKAKAHFDDRHKIEMEADDIICVADSLSGYGIVLEKTDKHRSNETVIGYVPLEYPKAHEYYAGFANIIDKIVAGWKK